MILRSVKTAHHEGRLQESSKKRARLYICIAITAAAVCFEFEYRLTLRTLVEEMLTIFLIVTQRIGIRCFEDSS